MSENIFALVSDKDFENKLFLMRKSLFKSTLDESIFSLPPYIILGKTDKQTFDRRHFNLKLIFDGTLVNSEYGLLLTPTDGSELIKIQDSLNLKPSPSGIYISKKAILNLDKPIISTHQRLVMLKKYQDGYIVLQ